MNLQEALTRCIPAKALGQATGLSARQIRKLRQGRNPSSLRESTAAIDAHAKRLQDTKNLKGDLEAFIPPDDESDEVRNARIKKILLLTEEIEGLEGKRPTSLLDQVITSGNMTAAEADEMARRHKHDLIRATRDAESTMVNALKEFDRVKNATRITDKEYKEIYGIAPNAETTQQKRDYVLGQLIQNREIAAQRASKRFHDLVDEARGVGYKHFTGKSTVELSEKFATRRNKSKKVTKDLHTHNAVSNAQLLEAAGR